MARLARTDLESLQDWTEGEIDVALIELGMSPDWTIEDATTAATLLPELHKRQGKRIWVKHHPESMPRGNLQNWSEEQIREARASFRFKAHLSQPELYLLHMVGYEIARRGRDQGDIIPADAFIR